MHSTNVIIILCMHLVLPWLFRVYNGKSKISDEVSQAYLVVHKLSQGVDLSPYYSLKADKL